MDRSKTGQSRKPKRNWNAALRVREFCKKPTMSVEAFVDSIVRETLARLGDAPEIATRRAIKGSSGRTVAIEFETPRFRAVWLKSRGVIVFQEKNGSRMRIVGVEETMRARGIAA